MQILLGNIIYAVVCWAAMLALGFVMYGRIMLTKEAVLMALNAFVFTLVALSLSFMVGSMIKSRYAQNAVNNVLSLGMCFMAAFLSRNSESMLFFIGNTHSILTSIDNSYTIYL